MPSVKFLLKLQGQGLPSASSMKSMQYSSAGPSGRGLIANRNSSGAPVTVEPAKKAPYDPLIGRIVMTRWPADNHFYEAVITDYNPVEVSLLSFSMSLLFLRVLWQLEISDYQHFTGSACSGL